MGFQFCVIVNVPVTEQRADGLTTNKTPPFTGSACIHASMASSVSPSCTWYFLLSSAHGAALYATWHELAANGVLHFGHHRSLTVNWSARKTRLIRHARRSSRGML